MSSHGAHRVLPGYGAVGTAKAALEANVRDWQWNWPRTVSR